MSRHLWAAALLPLWLAFLLLVQLLLAGCGAPPSAPNDHPDYCQVWVYPPGYLPVLWTCTSGKATDPPRLPCVERRGLPAEVSPDGATYLVPSCDQCVPAELLRLDPSARCTPGAQPEQPSWLPLVDGGGQPVSP